ncbi:ORF6N domain-containing protein [Limnobaculum xujianqingii]|uniref:ORF6N domain-containing protein n=1 Tax=Limnobaculum xujianqingii TaxID=2738837 RepID=UPI00112821D6|nr:ORF6N domain-containing protein [Limnobaculum xujianqingii]
MNNQLSVSSLPSITHNSQPVITTDLLAQLYGTDTANIKMNYSRNIGRFITGKHYFKLEGSELKDFKNKVTQSYLVAPRTKHLILWTERGAARHAKMLETDQAWEVFEKLEDCYFNQKPVTTNVVSQSEIAPEIWDLYNLNAINHFFHHIYDIYRKQIKPGLIALDSPIHYRLNDQFTDGTIFLAKLKHSLEKRAGCDMSQADKIIMQRF